MQSTSATPFSLRLAAGPVSAKKRTANQRNARHSTGPKTPEGKNRSRLNALTHGLFANDHLLLPSECKAEHDAVYRELENAVRPTDAVEVACTERMLAARWKLRRLKDTEQQLFDLGAKHTMEKREERYRYDLRYDANIKAKERKELEAKSHQRQKLEWATTIKPGELTLVYLKWDNLHKLEKFFEDRFYKAMRQIQMWRAEKRKNAGFEADEDDSLDAITPLGDAIQANEPTAESTNTTQAAAEPCDASSNEPQSESTEEIEHKLPANPIEVIQLTKPPPE